MTTRRHDCPGSTSITSIEHCAKQNHLTVHFVKGGKASFAGVTVDDFHRFAVSPSHGVHFNRQIKPNYRQI